GKKLDLSSFSNKPVIVTFFASWSKACQDQLLYLSSYANSQDLKIVGVSFDNKIKDLKKYLESEKVSFDIVLDKKLKMLEKYAILVIPTTFAIGKDGKIKEVFVDYDENIKNSIDKFVKEETAN
ncbi:MAG: alkyl hydroperoxide reductase/thiol specific antioxidant/Mal allergen, partial [Candidatus Saganbacteria bacterium]